MSEPGVISLEELMRGCFNRVENVKVGRSNTGSYVARYIYRHEANPHGDQVIWLLHHPKSMKPIKRELEHIQTCFQEWNSEVLVIDDYNPQRTSLAVDVAMFADGGASIGAFTIKRKDGVKGHIGVIIGQGRRLILSDPRVLTLIHMLLTNLLGRLKTPFINWGKARLEEFRIKAEKHGLKPVKVRVDRHSRVLKPVTREVG